MAVRQYVGARYVPKFYQNSQNPLSSEWEGNVAYEAMTVVTYNNSSYTSKIPVPAGIGNPANNPAYWAITGAYNAQVEQYRQDVQDAVSNINAEVQDRKDADAKLETQIITAPSIINRKFIFIGDSYGTGEGPDKTNTSYIELCRRLMGLTAGTNFWTKSIGGASWKGLNNRRSFQSLLEDIENDIVDKNSITDIIVCGGVNDASGTITDGLQGQSDFITYAKNTYPNATIRSGLIGWSTNQSTRRNIFNVSVPIYKTPFNGISALNISCPLHNYKVDFQSDGVHPTANGQNKIAWCITSAILFGHGTYCNPSYSAITISGSLLNDFNIGVFNNCTYFTYWKGNDTINFKSGASFPGWNKTVEIGTAKNADLVDSLYNGMGITVPICVGWNDGSVHETPAELTMWLNGGKMYGCFMSDVSISPTGLVYIIFSNATNTLPPELC